MAVFAPNITTKAAEYYHFLKVFDCEANFDHIAAINWFHQYWSSGFIFCTLYVLFIFTGRQWMEYREKFNLRVPLTVWSLFLAVFSWICALRFWSEFHYVVYTFGWHETVCDPVWFTSVSGFWGWIFAWSKLIEIGDTVFIVLRKQKLIFLHWYHHITVLLYSWYSYGNLVAPGRYFILFNATVHGFMYTYYALKASKLLTIPSWVNIFITFSQMLQMVIGILVNMYALHALNAGKECSTYHRNIHVSLMMYFSYFMLFVNFFYNAYFKKKRHLPGKKDVGDANKKEN